MTKTIVSLFDDFATAQRVAQELVVAGFSRDNISVMANDAAGEYGSQMGSDFGAESDARGVATGAGVGAAVGGIGGLLIGLGAIAIPGIGPVIAAGPLVSALVSAGIGAGVGAVAGGLVGALVDAGVPEEEAEYYAEGVRRGGALLTVQIPEETDEQQAMLIINRHQPVDIKERASFWGITGWTGFDPETRPYSAHDIAQERTSYRAYRAGSLEETGYGEDPRNAPNAGSRGWTEVEPAPGEESYRGDVTDDPNYGSRGWREVEPPAGEPMETGQTTSRTWSETKDNTFQGNLGGFVEDRPPAEGRVDIDQNAAYNRDKMADTARQGWEEVKDTARTAWQETKEAVGFDDDDFDTFDTRFREHYNTNYANTGYDYDTYYAPAYRYGYDLAYDVDYGDSDWTEIEPEARRYWESSYEGAWDQFKNAIRHAWEETKEAIGLEEEDDYDTFNTRFRQHYSTNYASSGYDYDTYYAPAYRYGYDLAYYPDYENRSWTEIEPEVRRNWETSNQGTWEQFKEAIRHAWAETKEAIGLEDDDDDLYDETNGGSRRYGENRSF